MEKVDIRFTGFDEPDIYDKYIEYKQIIQKDFRKISKELISKYKNSENLVSEMLFTAENVTYCRPYEDANEEEFIRFTDKYLSFSYPIFDQYYDIHYLNIVIVKNYKEFYFINFNVDDTNKTIKKFVIENNEVKEYEYQYYVPHILDNDGEIDLLILQLH